jgi:hypothetical protein
MEPQALPALRVLLALLELMLVFLLLHIRQVLVQQFQALFIMLNQVISTTVVLARQAIV